MEKLKVISTPDVKGGKVDSDLSDVPVKVNQNES